VHTEGEWHHGPLGGGSWGKPGGRACGERGATVGEWRGEPRVQRAAFFAKLWACPLHCLYPAGPVVTAATPGYAPGEIARSFGRASGLCTVGPEVRLR
jgi:hypothetical protein